MAEGPPQLTRAERAKTMREGASRYVSLAATLGVSKDEAAREVAAAWDGPRRGRGEES